MIAPSVALLALGALAVRAQQATELDLQYAQAQFIQSRIVPDMLAEFNPSAVLSVQFNSSDSPTPIGSALTIQDVVARPDITVMPAGNFSAEGAFTVAMVDPGVAGADQAPGQTRHWLVNNVYLIQGEDGNMSLNYTTDAITTYGGPYPAEGSGAHRYTILLLPQPTAFQSPADLSTPGIAISTMNFPDYIATTGLQAPVAGWYMQVEQGTSTVSAAETSAVQSSTLPAFGASSSAASMMSSGAASASASRSSTLAASGSAIQSDASVASGGRPSASASAGTSAAPGSAAFAQYAPSGALAVLAAGVFALL